MLGIVFYTWRQHDSIDWLSRQFPRALIIGVETSVKPFIWHLICPLQKMRCTLDKRAVAV
ncbi:unnamed protein product [Trichobilharzia regenti]|nr:unnamed protein product [Trichobilharzia regenti]